MVPTAEHVTLIEGATFAISGPNGDIARGLHGVYVFDARILSELVVLVDGAPVEPLAHHVDASSAATFLGRPAGRAGAGTATGDQVVVERRRWVGHGLREEVAVCNLGAEATYRQVELVVASDFADPVDVRAGRAGDAEVVSSVVDLAGTPVLQLARRRGRLAVRLRLVAATGSPEGCPDPAAVAAGLEPGRALYEVIVPAGGSFRVAVEVALVVDGDELEPNEHPGPGEGGGAGIDRRARWRRSVPRTTSDHAGLGGAVARAVEDLGSLRVLDAAVPERAVVAAGAPWAMALHGRTALVTAWMGLLVDPDLALGVLETLARLQGTAGHPGTEEEPGRILRELRFGVGRGVPDLLAADRGRAGDRLDYGAVDTTPLFVMLLGELRRWGLAPELVERLLPHVDAALDWVLGRLEVGHGFLTYERATDRGCSHQTWRDSPGAIRSADGRQAHVPLATAEVQGLVYAALVARSHFAREAGDEAGAVAWRTRATTFRQRFHATFWLEDERRPALAIDADGRPVDALGSHLGQLLWCGILDPEPAAAVAELLVGPELFSGYGVRTLASSTTGWHPLGPHHGAVWPHDTAIAAAGLARYGFVAEAHRLVLGLLEVADAFGGRVPEAVAGFGRDVVPFPVKLPEACAPSAWGAGSVLLCLRTLLRFEPWVPAGQLWLAPELPDGIGHLRVADIPLLGGRVTVDVDGVTGSVDVSGLPPTVTVHHRPRPPLGGPT